MGWLKDWAEDESRGPRNSAAWRAEHPEYTGPYRKPGTVLDLTKGRTEMGWLIYPELYERVPEPPPLDDE